MSRQKGATQGPRQSWEVEDEIHSPAIEHRADFKHGIAPGLVRDPTHRDCPDANDARQRVRIVENEGPAKQAILDFVRATTGQANPKFVPPGERIATFNPDGTLWVEHPVHSKLSTA